MVAQIQIPVCIENLAQIYTAFPDFFIAHVAEVYAVAKFIELGRVLGSRNAAWGETVAVTCHIGMAIYLERKVCTSAQTDRGGFEIAG